MNTTLLERDREKEREQEQEQRKSKGKRYRDMRRSRTIIQAEQLDILYGCYFKDPNPGKHEFEQISEWVHLPKKVVQIWFQNMRARERKGETLTGRCDACNVSFESRAAARAHVFSPRHLATLRTTNFGQPTALVNKSGTSSAALSTTVTSSGGGSEGEIIIELPPAMATSNS
uniref:Homeobox domain-containing protein n=1 Tax=Neolamprologus brichardi TaxID=32507 RepID=A0A3Q4NB77_NEOBR